MPAAEPVQRQPRHYRGEQGEHDVSGTLNPPCRPSVYGLTGFISEEQRGLGMLEPVALN